MFENSALRDRSIYAETLSELPLSSVMIVRQRLARAAPHDRVNPGSHIVINNSDARNLGWVQLENMTMRVRWLEQR